jgi:hypothetical protein
LARQSQLHSLVALSLLRTKRRLAGVRRLSHELCWEAQSLNVITTLAVSDSPCYPVVTVEEFRFSHIIQLGDRSPGRIKPCRFSNTSAINAGTISKPWFSAATKPNARLAKARISLPNSPFSQFRPKARLPLHPPARAEAVVIPAVPALVLYRTKSLESGGFGMVTTVP